MAEIRLFSRRNAFSAYRFHLVKNSVGVENQPVQRNHGIFAFAITENKTTLFIPQPDEHFVKRPFYLGGNTKGGIGTFPPGIVRHIGQLDNRTVPMSPGYDKIWNNEQNNRADPRRLGIGSAGYRYRRDNLLWCWYNEFCFLLKHGASPHISVQKKVQTVFAGKLKYLPWTVPFAPYGTGHNGRCSGNCRPLQTSDRPAARPQGFYRRIGCQSHTCSSQSKRTGQNSNMFRHNTV